MRARQMSLAVMVVVVGACSDQPTQTPTVPVPPPGAAELAGVPVLEVTISGIGTTTPTSTARMIPAFQPTRRTAAPARPLAGIQAPVPQREILRTPSGERLDFGRDGGWRREARRVSAQRQRLLSQGNFSALNAPMAAGGPLPSPAAITGTLRVPTVMFRYSDIGAATVAANAPASYADVLYGDPAPLARPYTLKTYFEEVSNDLLQLNGDILGWYTLSGTQASYTGGANCPGANPHGTSNCNGLFSDPASAARRAGLAEALTLADPATNFALYDNDGDDNIPNSGDDDGFVDMVLFIHSELDGACNSPGMWSHRGGISPFVTNDARFGGGTNILISDYTIQSGIGGTNGCTAGTDIMPIGTTAHETGHAFGLPDLYDTQGSTSGIGQFGLMGSGNYTTALSPSRMEAWSLNEMGWVTLRELTASGTYTLGPAPTSDSAFVVRVQGTNSREEYYFLENRQAVQSDSAMIRYHCNVSGFALGPSCRGGLAIWHADSTQILAGNGTNSVNTGAIHGLSLVQADGLEHLQTNNVAASRGDAGDLFPGYGAGTPNTVYGLHSTPKAVTNADENRFIGFKVDQITQVVPNGEMSLRLTFGRPLGVLAAGGALDGTIQLVPAAAAVSYRIGAFPAGFNYLSVTYQVRNATLAGNAYPTNRNNLTFLAVATPTTLDESAVTQFLRADGTPSPVTAAHLFPTGSVTNDGLGGVVANAADVLQAYDEASVAAMLPIAGVTSVLPYGYVVRNPNRANDRMLPASPGVSTYDGLVTFSFKVPLQASVTDDPYTIVAKFIAIDDDQTWITQSIEEFDAASIAAINARRTALGASVKTLIDGSTITGAEAICIRTAGPPGTPTQYIGDC